MNDLFEKALKAEGVTGQLADLARSIYKQESGGGKNTKTSNAGAVGGMQIIPSTFKSVADKGWDISNPEHNVRAGIRYVAEMFKKAEGDPRLAAIGYYGGPGGIAKARKGVAVADPRNPKAPNTFQYGDQVVARMGGTKDTSTGSEVAKELPSAPVQLAQVEAVPVADSYSNMAQQEQGVQRNEDSGPVYRASEVDPWQAFIQQVKPQVTPEALAYAPLVDMPQVKKVAMPMAEVGNRPNFSLLNALRGFA